MLAVARGSHSCAAEIDLGTTTPRKKPGPENLGSGDETRELHKTRVFHQIFNAADGPEKSGFRACLTEIRPKPPSINPQTRKKSHNQNPGFARKTQVTHSPIPGLSRVSPRSRVFPGCLCCVLRRGRVFTVFYRGVRKSRENDEGGGLRPAPHVPRAGGDGEVWARFGI